MEKYRREPGGKTQAQTAAHSLGGLLSGAFGSTHRIHHLLGFLLKDLTGFGELHLALAAQEKLHSQHVLDTLADLRAQGWLSHVQLLGRPAEVQLLGHGQEVAKMPQFNHTPEVL